MSLRSPPHQGQASTSISKTRRRRGRTRGASRARTDGRCNTLARGSPADHRLNPLAVLAYLAPSYRFLADSPLLLGELSTTGIQVGDIAVDIFVHSPVEELDAEEVLFVAATCCRPPPTSSASRRSSATCS